MPRDESIWIAVLDWKGNFSHWRNSHLSLHLLSLVIPLYKPKYLLLPILPFLLLLLLELSKFHVPANSLNDYHRVWLQDALVDSWSKRAVLELLILSIPHFLLNSLTLSQLLLFHLRSQCIFSGNEVSHALCTLDYVAWRIHFARMHAELQGGRYVLVISVDLWLKSAWCKLYLFSIVCFFLFHFPKVLKLSVLSDNLWSFIDFGLEIYVSIHLFFDCLDSLFFLSQSIFIVKSFKVIGGVSLNHLTFQVDFWGKSIFLKALLLEKLGLDLFPLHELFLTIHELFTWLWDSRSRYRRNIREHIWHETSISQLSILLPILHVSQKPFGHMDVLSLDIFWSILFDELLLG